MASESTKADQLSPLQFVGVVAVTTLIGGMTLSWITSGRDQPVKKTVQEAKTIPILPEYPTNSPPPRRPRAIRSIRPSSSVREAIVLVPDTQTEVDCVLGGGGVACFDEEYRPNYPSNSNRREWADWERSKRQEEDWFKNLFN